MEVTYTLAPEDLKQFEKHVNGRGAIPRWAFFLIVVVVAVGSFALQYWAESRRPHYPPVRHNPSNPMLAILSMLVPILLFLLFWTIILRMNSRAQKKLLADPMFTTPSTVRISPENFYQRNAGTGETTLFWKALHDISQDDHCFYFLTSAQSAYIVPRRAFPDADTARRFYQEVCRFWTISRGEEVDPPIPAPPKSD